MTLQQQNHPPCDVVLSSAIPLTLKYLQKSPGKTTIEMVSNRLRTKTGFVFLGGQKCPSKLLKNKLFFQEHFWHLWNKVEVQRYLDSETFCWCFGSVLLHFRFEMIQWLRLNYRLSAFIWGCFHPLMWMLPWLQKIVNESWKIEWESLRHKHHTLPKDAILPLLVVVKGQHVLGYDLCSANFLTQHYSQFIQDYL